MIVDHPGYIWITACIGQYTAHNVENMRDNTQQRLVAWANVDPAVPMYWRVVALTPENNDATVDMFCKRLI